MTVAVADALGVRAAGGCEEKGDGSEAAQIPDNGHDRYVPFRHAPPRAAGSTCGRARRLSELCCGGVTAV